MKKQQLSSVHSAEQRRVIEDIASWKNESKRGKLSVNKLREYIRELSKLEMGTLHEIWFDTVGQWLLSRHEIGPVDNRDEWLTGQFNAVKTCSQTDYGYVRGVSLLRYSIDS